MSIDFRCRKFYIETKRVKLPNGDVQEFSTLVKRPGANIIPLLGDGTLLLALQYRPAVKKWVYQLAGGRVERGETPRQNAFKELEEELGYRAKEMRLIGKMYSAPHISNDLQYIFVAKGLKKTKKHLEKGEDIKTKRLKISTAIKMAREGKIEDAVTVAALLMLNHRANVYR